MKARMTKTISCHMITATVIARAAQEMAAVPKRTTTAPLVTPEREVKFIVQNNTVPLSVQLQ